MARPERDRKEQEPAPAENADGESERPIVADEIAALERRLDRDPPSSGNLIELAAGATGPRARSEPQPMNPDPVSGSAGERGEGLSPSGREHKLRYLEASDRRLQQIEERAASALDRLAEAESRLDQERRRLRQRDGERARALEKITADLAALRRERERESSEPAKALETGSEAAATDVARAEPEPAQPERSIPTGRARSNQPKPGQ